jgi:tetratricopeptide (TPR) repeat protein
LADLQKLVRVMANENRYAEAEKLLDKVLTPTFAAQAASAGLLAQRVNLMGRRGRWQEAADAATVAVELQPTDHYRYHTLAGLLVVNHNRPAYERLCKDLVARFGDTLNPYIAERVVQDCLVSPNSGVDLALVDRLADTAVTRGGGEAALPYFQAAKAMSDYRLGRFNEAIEWAEKAAMSPTAEAPAKAKAFAVQAMANWQLGKMEAAREMLAKVDTLTPSISREGDAGDLGESWVAWLMARISIDEAKSLTQSVGKNANRP